jgi:hypothetical protein
MIVGRTERISFPELNLCMDAKVDTGAWRTALHVDGIELVDDILIFWIGNRDNCYEFKEYEIIKVRNSFGLTQERYSIKLKIRIGGKSYKVLVSLTDRNNMKYPCLIGRRFLRRYGLLVDVRKKNISDRYKKI